MICPRFGELPLETSWFIQSISTKYRLMTFTKYLPVAPLKRVFGFQPFNIVDVQNSTRPLLQRNLSLQSSSYRSCNRCSGPGIAKVPSFTRAVLHPTIQSLINIGIGILRREQGSLRMASNNPYKYNPSCVQMCIVHYFDYCSFLNICQL